MVRANSKARASPAEVSTHQLRSERSLTSTEVSAHQLRSERSLTKVAGLLIVSVLTIRGLTIGLPTIPV